MSRTGTGTWWVVAPPIVIALAYLVPVIFAPPESSRVQGADELDLTEEVESLQLRLAALQEEAAALRLTQSSGAEREAKHVDVELLAAEVLALENRFAAHLVENAQGLGEAQLGDGPPSEVDIHGEESVFASQEALRSARATLDEKSRALRALARLRGDDDAFAPIGAEVTELLRTTFGTPDFVNVVDSLTGAREPRILDQLCHLAQAEQGSGELLEVVRALAHGLGHPCVLPTLELIALGAKSRAQETAARVVRSYHEFGPRPRRAPPK